MALKSLIENLDGRQDLYPPRPNFCGSFNYQQGNSREFFVPIERKFIPIEHPDRNGFMLQYGYSFTIQWLWIDNQWVINMSVSGNMGYKKKKQEVFKG